MAHGSCNSRGVAILVKKGVDCTIHSKILDPLGRYVILKAEINDKLYVLKDRVYRTLLASQSCIYFIEKSKTI